MQKESLVYENDYGEKIEIAYSFPYFFKSLQGGDGLEAEISTTKGPNQDGTTVTNTTLNDRSLQIYGSIKGDTKEKIASYKANLFKVFNPKVKGTLQYEYGDIKRQLRCYVEVAPKFSKINKSYKYHDFVINLIAPIPFWTDEKESSQDIVTWLGGLTFPLTLPTTFSTGGELKKNIINDGDVETPVRIEITGSATNPKIINNLTGEYIKVNKTLLETETLVITTDFGNKRVELDGVNVFNYIDLSSTFFSLSVGDNVLELITDDVEDSAEVKIIHYNRYLGI